MSNSNSYAKLNHEERVLKYMQENKDGITPLSAWRDLGVYRLSDCIWKLRNSGHTIITDKMTARNRFDEKCSFARYYMVQA
jgi:hypothetical protein